MTDNAMQREVTYKVHVEPNLFTVFSKMEHDMGNFNISRDEFIRALWVYADMKLNEYPTPPQWLWQELDNKRQQSEASNTVDGEVGG